MTGTSLLSKYFLKHYIIAIILLASAVAIYFTASFAHAANGGWGFPIDDPWIHLQFAKNFHDFGVFSYYKNVMATSGSTSPLYTFLLSAGFFLTSDEMLLSYALGSVFFLTAVYFLFRWMMTITGNSLIAAASVAALAAVEPHLLWSALSGMETTLFIALITSSFYYYSEHRKKELSVVFALLLWTRPEGIVIPFIFFSDWIYSAWISMPEKNRKGKTGRSAFPSITTFWFRIPCLIFFISAALYCMFNFTLSGSFLPNTYGAKIAYYQNGNKNFLPEAFDYFSTQPFSFFFYFFAAGAILVFYSLLRKKADPFLPALMFTLILFAAYWKELPFLFHNGRYLMPLIPFFIAIGINGAMVFIRMLSEILPQSIRSRSAAVATGLLGTLFFVQFAFSAFKERAAYASECSYISDRQVRTAKWIDSHLPENAVVATHDIGAIAFYSKRRIVDMVGLVSPEMINRMGRWELLIDFLKTQQVTHCVVLRNWFEIANQDQLFQTDERTPEIMEVFRFNPENITLIHPQISSLLIAAQTLLGKGDIGTALQALDRAIAVDPSIAKSQVLRGNAFLLGKNDSLAEESFRNALQHHPFETRAYIGLANAAWIREKPMEAIALLDTLITHQPDQPAALKFQAELVRLVTGDQHRAGALMRRAKELE